VTTQRQHQQAPRTESRRQNKNLPIPPSNSQHLQINEDGRYK
jgi:hypothetical protein